MFIGATPCVGVSPPAADSATAKGLALVAEPLAAEKAGAIALIGETRREFLRAALPHHAPALVRNAFALAKAIHEQR